MRKVIYTTTFHAARRRMGITCDEYTLIDFIFKAQSDPAARVPGWCDESRNDMAEFLVKTSRGIQKMLERLERLDLIEIHPGNRMTRATRAWYNAVVAENEKLPRPMNIGTKPLDITVNRNQIEGEQSSPHEQSSPMNKVHTKGEQSSPTPMNKVHRPHEQSSPLGVNKVHRNNKEVKEVSKNKVNNKKQAGETPPVIHRMVEVFEKNHQKHFQDDAGDWTGFVWSQKEFGALKGLKTKLEKSFEITCKRTPNENDVIASFEKFLIKCVEADTWFLKLFTPTGLNGNYQNVVQRIHQHANSHNSKNNPTGGGANPFFAGYGNTDQTNGGNPG